MADQHPQTAAMRTAVAKALLTNPGDTSPVRLLADWLEDYEPESGTECAVLRNTDYVVQALLIYNEEGTVSVALCLVPPGSWLPGHRFGRLVIRGPQQLCRLIVNRVQRALRPRIGLLFDLEVIPPEIKKLLLR